MNLIKLIIPFDAHANTKKITGNFIYYLDTDVNENEKYRVVSYYVSYQSVFLRGKFWDEWQLNEQNAIELNHTNIGPIHSVSKMLSIDLNEIEISSIDSMIHFNSKISRIWNFAICNFLKNEFDYSYIDSYRGPTNRNSVITYYSKLNEDLILGINEIKKISFLDYILLKENVLERICDLNPDLYEFLVEQKGYQLNNPGTTPDLREWLITKYKQKNDEIHAIIKKRSKYWAKLINNEYQSLKSKYSVENNFEYHNECFNDCMEKLQPLLNIAKNLMSNWIAFWRYQNLVKENKLNKIYRDLFVGHEHGWNFLLDIKSLLKTNDWKELTNYLDPDNIAWIPTVVANLIYNGVITIGKRGLLYDLNGNQLTHDQLRELLSFY